MTIELTINLSDQIGQLKKSEALAEAVKRGLKQTLSP